MSTENTPSDDDLDAMEYRNKEWAKVYAVAERYALAEDVAAAAIDPEQISQLITALRAERALRETAEARANELSRTLRRCAVHCCVSTMEALATEFAELDDSKLDRVGELVSDRVSGLESRALSAEARVRELEGPIRSLYDGMSDAELAS